MDTGLVVPGLFSLSPEFKKLIFIHEKNTSCLWHPAGGNQDGPTCEGLSATKANV